MVGIDIVEIERFKKIENLDLFLDKTCTKNEMEYLKNKANKYETLAGIFAAKEAIAKALGMGLSKMTMKGAEILHYESGAPYAVLYGTAKTTLGTRKLYVSISHSGTSAVAMAQIYPQ